MDHQKIVMTITKKKVYPASQNGMDCVGFDQKMTYKAANQKPLLIVSTTAGIRRPYCNLTVFSCQLCGESVQSIIISLFSIPIDISIVLLRLPLGSLHPSNHGSRALKDNSYSISRYSTSSNIQKREKQMYCLMS